MFLKVSKVIHCELQNVSFFKFALSDLRGGDKITIIDNKNEPQQQLYRCRDINVRWCCSSFPKVFSTGPNTYLCELVFSFPWAVWIPLKEMQIWLICHVCLCFIYYWRVTVHTFFPLTCLGVSSLSVVATILFALGLISFSLAHKWRRGSWVDLYSSSTST